MCMQQPALGAPWRKSGRAISSVRLRDGQVDASSGQNEFAAGFGNKVSLL